MFKKAICLAILLLLVATFSFAQVRNPVYNYEGKSNFADVSVTGLDVTGNPGYIEMVDTEGTEWYMYINSGVVYIISDVTTAGSGFTSFPTGSWTTFLGTKVGGQ